MKTLIALLFAAVGLWAQNPAQIIPTTVDPTGQTCNATRMNEKTPDGKIYTCQNGHMAQIQGAAVGSVTSVACTAPAVCTPSPITGAGTISAPTVVVGPASVTDSHLAVFDGTTGKLVKDGGAITAFSISTTCGVSGGPITATGTVSGIETPNAQTGTTYAILNSDCGKLVTQANGSAIADSIAQAGSGGNFPAGWYVDVQNTGVGTVTITPATSTINGAATLTLLTGQGVRIVSNGTDYLIAGSIGNGSTVQNVTINNSTTNNIKLNHSSLNGTELTNLFPNAASTGTTVNKLVKLTGAGTGVISSAGDTGGVIGICTGNTSTGASACGTSGSSEIAIQGTYSCVFDGATTADDYVTISTSVAGDCHDFGATYPIGQQVLGRVLVTAAAGTRSMVLFGPEFNSSVRPFVCVSPGLGDGLNAMTAGTYLQSNCYNYTGSTVTITGVKCLTDNSGTTTANVTNGAGTALLTGAITCANTYQSGTQSGTTTLANADFLKFTFVADGTSKQVSAVVLGTY